MINAQEDECNQPKKTTDEDVVTSVFGYVLTQYGLMKGLGKYGSKGEEAMEKELTQIHNMDALMPIDASLLYEEEKKKVIASLIFFNRKER